MREKDRELLLKDLCARLPYGVKILHEGWNYEWDDSLSTVERVVGIDELFVYTKVIDTHTGEEYREDSHSIDLFDDKPYLRPMSDLSKKFGGLSIYDIENPFTLFDSPIDAIDYFVKNHFDFRGLIPKGLAIEVTEENNPYKD